MPGDAATNITGSTLRDTATEGPAQARALVRKADRR